MSRLRCPGVRRDDRLGSTPSRFKEGSFGVHTTPGRGGVLWGPHCLGSRRSPFRVHTARLEEGSFGVHTVLTQGGLQDTLPRRDGEHPKPRGSTGTGHRYSEARGGGAVHRRRDTEGDTDRERGDEDVPTNGNLNPGQIYYFLIE